MGFASVSHLVFKQAVGFTRTGNQPIHPYSRNRFLIVEFEIPESFCHASSDVAREVYVMLLVTSEVAEEAKQGDFLSRGLPHD